MHKTRIAAAMEPRSRFHAVMEHRQPDRVPVDLAGTSLTGMSDGFQQRLKDFLGFEGEGEKANHGVDTRILEWAGTDFRSVGEIPSLHGSLARTISPVESIDEWGVRRKFLNGYWEICECPLAGASMEELEAFPWPSPELDDSRLEAWRAEAKHLAEDTPYVVVGEHPVYGVLELGCWMCGYDGFLLRMAMEPDFVKRFFDRVLSIQLRVLEQYLGAIGEYIALATSGDDFGMQSGPLISPDMFRSLVVPYFTRRITRTKELGRGCYYWHHTCGSVVSLLDGIMACGVDILNPVQTSAAGMQPAALKAAHGGELAFWGAIDTQDLLRNGTPEMVRAVVLDTIQTLGCGGGYVLAPAHNIQADVPPENVAAMIEAAHS